MRHTYEAPNLLPAGGQERTYALLIGAVPLVLLLFGVLPQLGSGGDGSGTGPLPDRGGNLFGAPTSLTREPETATTYGSAPSLPASGGEATGPTPSPLSPWGEETTPSPDATASAADDPATVVNRYFEAINDRDFRTAWDLGGKNFDSSYESFAEGFDKTERDELTIESTLGNRVTVSLVAVLYDGTVQTYSGYYTVVDGLITDGSLDLTG
ncbi:hypothetical protein [Streptomyces sp. TRM68416]|uniref:hypothetical protein n=1 Tax=Streptomyces sp. TRM68416 TaxID=2758412 RepID=UPI001661FD15|nr:hypothetical protein [Streptomyces sp. TRM68416]MBD0837707.1 hypothetical protein [Streptomyces sp. TRM68416]